MAVYDRALSLAEVQQNYAAGSTGTGGGNLAPVASDDSASGPQDTAVVVSAPGVLSNDSDPNSDQLTALLDTNPSNGIVLLNSDGSFTYTPNTGFSGTDSFTYHAYDGELDSNSATVTVTITAGNTAPVATDDSASTGARFPPPVPVEPAA